MLVWRWGSFTVFFFFQAEDGIRYADVTGVQTCALPICPRRLPRLADGGGPEEPDRPGGRRDRSEERRVGKECRSRWSPKHKKKKKKKKNKKPKKKKKKKKKKTKKKQKKKK